MASLVQKRRVPFITMKCLVCDFGGSSVKYALVDEFAVMENSGKVAAPLGSLEDFVECIGKLYDRYKDEIEGIAVSIGPGSFTDYGEYTKAVNLTDLGPVALGRLNVVIHTLADLCAPACFVLQLHRLRALARFGYG